MEMTVEQKRALALAAARKRAQEKAGEPTYSGTLLPFSKAADGSVSFDSNAGVVGAFKRAFTLPHDVMTGEIDPMSGEGMDRAMEMATIVSPVNPGIRAGDKVVPGAARAAFRRAPVPTSDELLKAGAQGFDAMRTTGAQYPSASVKAMAERAMIKMNEAGFDDVTAPKTFRTLRALASPPENSVATISNLHSARKTFGKIGQNFNDPTDQGAARTAIGELDRFIGMDDPGAAMAQSAAGQGTATPGPGMAGRVEAARLLAEANANYAAGRRSDLTQGIERAADLRAASANSGQNTGNAIRQRVASALLREKDTAGFSAAEKDALEGIVRGSRAANATRTAGNLLGGGGGLGGLTASGIGGAAGATMGGPAGAAAGAVLPVIAARVLKTGSNRLTENALRMADELIRQRSPLFERRFAIAPETIPSSMGKEAVIKALLAQQALQNQ